MTAGLFGEGDGLAGGLRTSPDGDQELPLHHMSPLSGHGLLNRLVVMSGDVDPRVASPAY